MLQGCKVALLAQFENSRIAAMVVHWDVNAFEEISHNNKKHGEKFTSSKMNSRIFFSRYYCYIYYCYIYYKSPEIHNLAGR